MAARASTLVTPLASLPQLAQSASRLDGVPPDVEDSLRFAGARLTLAAGAVLRLPQNVCVAAVVLLQRFFVGPEGASFAGVGVEDASAAALYTTAKTSALPKSPRSVVNAYAYLAARRAEPCSPSLDAEAYYVSESAYAARKAALFRHEALMMRTVGFQTHVALPHSVCINYLQALEVFAGAGGTGVAARALAHLNSLAMSPQLVYLTHAPAQLATAAVYLAARERAVKLPEAAWWEVFDTEREELGFLVVAMTSMPGFAAAEAARWGPGGAPVTVAGVQAALALALDGGGGGGGGGPGPGPGQGQGLGGRTSREEGDGGS